jgi:hypothetical protein
VGCGVGGAWLGKADELPTPVDGDAMAESLAEGLGVVVPQAVSATNATNATNATIAAAEREDTGRAAAGRGLVMGGAIIASRTGASGRSADS